MQQVEPDPAQQTSPTEDLIEQIRSSNVQKKLILNESFLDDEKLSEHDRVLVLQEIFSQRIRQTQLHKIITQLSPVLNNQHPEHICVVGPTGSGKSVSVLHVLYSLQNVAQKRNVKFKYIYMDLSSPKSSFSAFNELAISLDDQIKRYRKGMPVYLMQQIIQDIIGAHDGYLCLLIDEINNIKPAPDEFLTFLGKTLPRKVKCRLIMVLLTNRFDWDRNLDPRVLSFLKKSDITFEPYNALEILDILRLRVAKALNPSLVEESALKKIAALASRETGDARKAVELLAKAAHLADKATGHLTEAEVDLAHQRIEVDKTEALIRVLAAQQRLALESCYLALGKNKKKVSTGEAYEAYVSICAYDRVSPLTQRRFSDMLSFLDLYGLITARVVSHGRYGNTRDISAALPPPMVKRVLRESYQ